MGIIFSLLLIVLGIVAAGPWIEQKLPASVPVITKLREYKEQIGLLGLLAGVITVIEWLLTLHYLSFAPVYMLVKLVAAIVSLALGLILGLELIRRNLKEPNMPALIKAESLRVRLFAYQQNMGLAAIVLGLFFLLRHF